MLCPACGTANRDDALFCKYCGHGLAKPGAAPPPEPAAVPPPPAAPTPPPAVPPAPAARVWWHGLGVFVILALFFIFIDVAMTLRLTWSPVAVLATAFLAGAVMVLQFLASADRRDRRPFVAGAILLAAAVLLLPVTLTVQSSGTWTEALPAVPYDAGIARLDVVVSNDVGQITVDFAPGTATLVQGEVVHLGGLFSSHYEGDVVASNGTVGDTLTYTVRARGFGGLFFAGGHHVSLTLNRALSTSLTLTSTTGNVAVDLPAGLVVRGVVVTVTTGGITIAAQGCTFADGAAIEATSTTGNVAVNIDQPAGGPGTVTVRETTTTGQIAFAFDRTSASAARVQSQVTTGSIDFDAAKYAGTDALLYAPDQATYESAGLKFQVFLQSTTGSIGIG